MPIHHYALLAACFFSIGFFVFGPQMLIGLAATEYCHKNAAGTVTGYLGLYAYLGAAIAGWPLSQVMAHYGWTGMFVLLTSAAALMGLLLMPLLIADVSKREHLVGPLSFSDDDTFKGSEHETENSLYTCCRRLSSFYGKFIHQCRGSLSGLLQCHKCDV